MTEKDYDPAVKDFMMRAAKNLRKGAKSNDAALMWAILFNLKGVVHSYESAAEEALLIAKLNHDIDKHNEQAEIK